MLLAAEIILSTAACVGALLFIVLQKAESSRTRTAINVMLVGSFLWNVTSLFSLIGATEILAPLVYVSAIIFVVGRYWFAFVYSNAEYIRPNIFAPSIALGLFFGIAAFIPGMLFTDVFLHPDGYVVAINGVLSKHFSLFLLYLTIVPPLVLFFQWRSHKASKIAAQDRLIFIGLSIYAVVSISTNAILPIGFGIYQLNTIGPAFSLAFDVFVLYAIFRHQFLEIKPYLQRGLIYTFLIGLILTIYTVLLLFLIHVAKIQNAFVDILSAATVLVFGIFTIPHLEASLRKITDPWFFKNTYSYSQVAHELGVIFAQYSTRAKVLKHSLSFIRNTLHLTRCTFVPNDRKIHHADTATLIPVPSTSGPVGTLIIGIKRSGDPLTNQDRRLLELYAALLGIALEKAILYEELEDRVAERTAEVETLYKKQEKLYAELAHALQTPFTVLKGTFELVRKKAPDMETEHLKAFERSVQDTARLATDLLLLSRHQLKESKRAYTKVSLKKITSSVVDYVRTICESEDITLETHIGDIPTIYGSKHDLEELVTNLLSNAVRYTKDCNTRHIGVSLTATDSAVQLTIEDTGIGIPEEDLPYVFKRGYRSAATADIDGNGIGLAIVNKIATAHGAHIKIESAPGEGTRIMLTFPLHLADSK